MELKTADGFLEKDGPNIQASAGIGARADAEGEVFQTFFHAPSYPGRGRNLYLRDSPSARSGQALRLPAKGLRPSAHSVLQQPDRAADRARTDNEDGSDLPAKVRLLNGVPTHSMAHARSLVAVGSKYGQCVCAYGLSVASVTKAERKSRRLSNLLSEA